jgi:hypothetical protein
MIYMMIYLLKMGIYWFMMNYSLNTQKKSDLLPLSSPFSTAFDAASCNFT